MRWITLAAAALLAVLLWQWWPAGEPPATTEAPSARTTAETGHVATRADAAPHAILPPARMDPDVVLRTGSLRGTAVDGNVTLGFAGRVQPDLVLRRLFDYYLSLLGETDLDGIRQLLHEDLQRRALAADQQATVFDFFERYVHYQQARTALARQAGSDVADLLEQDQALREQLLGAALAQAFYPDAAAERGRLLAALSPHLAGDAPADPPTPDRGDTHLRETAGATIQAQTEQLDRSGADPQQRHAERAAAWGEQAADRLDALDRQRAQWQQRLDDFARAASALQADRSISEADRRQAVQELLARRFQGPERQQAQAMWQAGVLPRKR